LRQRKEGENRDFMPKGFKVHDAKRQEVKPLQYASTCAIRAADEHMHDGIMACAAVAL
jgi:hypothetical protein